MPPGAAVDKVLTVGDRQFAWRFTLRDPDGVPYPLTAVTILMVSASATPGVVKINNAVATITPGVDGEATYAPAAVDVDTADKYYLWAKDTKAGKVNTWPPEGRADGKGYLVEFRAAA